MSLKIPVKVQLFVGMIAADSQIMDQVTQRLCVNYGPVVKASDTWDFTHTEYYASEFGEHLKRCFVAFKNLIEQDDLAGIKRETIILEEEWAADSGDRRINLDPGYLTAAKVVLATTKDYAHRLYLGQKIYGEVTLSFKSGQPVDHPWTYREYISAEYSDYFARLRVIYMCQVA